MKIEVKLTKLTNIPWRGKMKEAFLAEQHGIKGNVPYDMNTVTTLSRISMAKSDRVAIVCNMGDSVGATVAFTLKQHTLAAGGTTKDLSVDNPYYKKVGAATKFTKVEPLAVAAAYDLSTDFAADEGIVVFEVLGEDLDNENGFEFISIEVADSTTAKILSVVYHAHNVEQKPAYSVDL